MRVTVNPEVLNLFSNLLEVRFHWDYTILVPTAN